MGSGSLMRLVAACHLQKLDGFPRCHRRTERVPENRENALIFVKTACIRTFTPILFRLRGPTYSTNPGPEPR
jgi:hypothetical protein